MSPSEPPQLRFIEYRDLFDIVGRYWRAYGGWRELLASPYVHIAALLAMLCSGYWMGFPWYDLALSVLPNLLGFGVTGYAIWIGWGDEKLREVLIDLEDDNKGSFYVQISAIFAHFGLVQVIALLSALMCKAFDYELSPTSGLARCFAYVGQPAHLLSCFKPIGSGISFFMFVYAILTALETTIALFRLATWLQSQRRLAKLAEAARQQSRGPSMPT